MPRVSPPPTPAPISPSFHGRLFRWFASTGKPEMPEVRHAMLLTLREPFHVTLLAFFWTQVIAGAVWAIEGAGWALAWLLLDMALFASRIVFIRRIAAAEARGQRLPAKPVFLVHTAWLICIAIGTVLTVSQNDLRLVLLGAVLPVGFCGYVVSRWQAFPRCALAFIYALWIGLWLGLLISPLPHLAQMAWLVPPGGLAFQVLLGLNHDILAGALRAQQENRRLSMHDPLTELPNRLMLSERLAALCRRLSLPSAPEPFTVLCLDLDGFKAVNDRHGHAAGDWLLKSVADRLGQTVRAKDLVCRVGGDEFVVLLPGAHEEVAIEIAERLLAAVEGPHDLGGLATVLGRTSVGIAVAPVDGGDPERLLAVADDGLYAAKRAGRGTWRLGRQDKDVPGLRDADRQTRQRALPNPETAGAS
jgi:diguanylate cyclase (GGDEF)-like protein